MEPNCIFCKIVNKEIPSSKVYEDKHHLAFLDIAPVNKGHTLLIPKQHYEDLFDMPEDMLALTGSILKKLSAAVMKGVKADGVNVGVNNKSAAGQIVFHAHFHIIPRFNQDGLKAWPHKKYENVDEMGTYKDKIQMQLLKPS